MVNAPDHVRELRGAGKSWAEVATELGVTASVARRSIGEARRKAA
jgi:hypothetical protein